MRLKALRQRVRRSARGLARWIASRESGCLRSRSCTAAVTPHESFVLQDGDLPPRAHEQLVQWARARLDAGARSRGVSREEMAQKLTSLRRDRPERVRATSIRPDTMEGEPYFT